MSRYMLSRLAVQHLLDIWEHIAANSIDAADRVSNDIERALEMLAANQRMGHLREDLVTQPLRFYL